jgi:hypothetical protein
VGITFGRLSPSYWINYLGFITEGKLAAIFIKPSLGVSNWPVIFTSSTNTNNFLAPSSPRHQRRGGAPTLHDCGAPTATQSTT